MRPQANAQSRNPASGWWWCIGCQVETSTRGPGDPDRSFAGGPRRRFHPRRHRAPDHAPDRWCWLRLQCGQDAPLPEVRTYRIQQMVLPSSQAVISSKRLSCHQPPIRAEAAALAVATIGAGRTKNNSVTAAVTSITTRISPPISASSGSSASSKYMILMMRR